MVFHDSGVDIVEEVVRYSEERKGGGVARIDLDYLFVCVFGFFESASE